jgi:hypothetical protein
MRPVRGQAVALWRGAGNSGCGLEAAIGYHGDGVGYLLGLCAFVVFLYYITRDGTG